ncbi:MULTISPECIES: hypothetical protein [Sphingobium]|jgi:hypothetical protein|uniref:Uncharacterized protein n=1 Tax=Sphingobium limneticum TaxID=1007511 RepID=A0A5J5HXU5_9SPHN|nr:MULTISPECIES: hypothetical protein [Sphingobium]KAA9012863.1 hypothetical protein F4U94_17365 [Sphingobium limneticum]KAA9013490.1 hypothetical protein F4U96_18335 [Sphingobium limneticum]KAA9026552.1 hypothetical protein F4U95_18460 [Sphingobium limneticum]MBU0930429.1 hypothetical protein [Alphaproteobacteria bacterium]
MTITQPLWIDPTMAQRSVDHSRPTSALGRLTLGEILPVHASLCDGERPIAMYDRRVEDRSITLSIEEEYA